MSKTKAKRRGAEDAQERAELLAMDQRLVFIEAIARGESVCVMCGCSDYNACPEGCEWSVIFPSAPVGVCSGCFVKFLARVVTGSIQTKKGRPDRSGRVKPFEP